MSYAPKGPTDGTAPLRIQLDKPAIDAGMVGKPVDPGMIVIAPAVVWKGYWEDRQTIVIEPISTLAPSTRYEVSLSGDLAARTDKFSFSFVNKPLSIDASDDQSLPPGIDVPLAFNQPVRPADVAQHCTLTGPDTAAPIALAVDPGEASAKLVAHAASRLQPGASYQLGCVDLPGAGGNAGEPIAAQLNVRAGLTVTGISLDGDDVPPDDAQLVVSFSNPVSLDDARAAIKSTPPIAKLDQGYLSYDGVSYTVTTDLDAKAKYTITVDAIKDAFGDKLEKPFVASFKTGDARGRLAMDRGIYAVEASAKGYPLWTRNVARYDLKCAAIPKDQLVGLLTTTMNYDPWGGTNQDADLDWDKLGVKPRQLKQDNKERNKWHLDEVDLGATCGGGAGKRGVYLAEVSSEDVQVDQNRPWRTPAHNRVLANVTDLGVLIKVGSASGVVWVTSLATGQPVGGARVTVYTPDGKAVYTATSDGNGLVSMPGTATLKPKPKKVADPNDYESSWESYREQRLIATVEKGGDLAVVDGNWSNGLQIWNFSLPEDRSGGKTRVRGFIESDRGLYRPGEQVHFKGIVREVAPNSGPRPPARQPVAVEVRDSRGQEVLTTKSQLSAFGGFTFDLQLASDASLGDYYVTATVGDQPFFERFTVEEFRPAAFELALKADNPDPKNLKFDLDAKFLFGSPVTDAKVEWNVRKRKHRLRFPSFDEYTFSADVHDYWWYEREGSYGEFIGDGTGQTDAQGHMVVEAKDEADPSGPIDYIVSTAVTDSSDQTINKSAIITSHQAQFYVGLHSNEYVQAVNMPFGVNLVAVKPDGTRIATKAHLQFIKTSWQCLYDYRGYRSYGHCTSSDKVVLERDLDIADGGSHTERLVPDAPGDYIVKVTAKDGAGHEVAAASELWVVGKGEAWWNGDEGERMTMITSKPHYEVGDVARLVPMANLASPTALVTIEREGIMESRVIKLDSAAEGVSINITDNFAPNVFASVTMVSGRHGPTDKDRPQFKMGTVELKVSSERKQLAVAVELDRDTVRPGDKVTGRIKVTAGGAPVQSEVALSVADEGVLQLIDYQTPNPMKTFYASYGLGVDSGTNWNRIARMLDPDGNDPDQGGDMSSKLNAGKVRSKFVASAYWAPMLVTNEQGEVPFSFTAPDNLSAFRLMAVAADARDRFGSGDKRLTVNKPLMAVPVLPRFLRTGDTATVGVVVHNTTSVAGSAVITAKATGATLDGTSQTVALPANGEVRVRFGATTGDGSSASFSFAVAMGKDRDAVEVVLPVGKPRTFQTRTLVATMLDAGMWKGSLATDKEVIRSESTLAVSIDRTGVGELGPSLRTLVEYPYGCLEQTMSRFVPLVAAKDLADSLDEPSLKGTKAEEYIKFGVAKVIRHQQADGLFSLWPTSQTYPHLAAYALWGLTVAQQQGKEEVPAEVFDKGIAALTAWTNDNKNLRPDGSGATMAMSSYIMSLRGKPNAALNARLFAVKHGLPVWGQAFLLRAMALAKADTAQIGELEAEIASHVTTTAGIAMAHEGASKGDDFEMYWSTDTRATAMVLAALLDADPSSKLIDPLAAGLKSQRNEGGSWHTTQENVWSLVALAQYAHRGGTGALDTTVTVGGKVLAKRHVAGTQVATFKLPLTDATGDDIAISVSGTAHVSARITEARADAGAAEAAGYTITRTYRNDKGEPIDKFTAGTIVDVSLDITAGDSHRWVAVSDPLPAGFEPVNDKLNAGQAADPSTRTNSEDDRNWYWDRLWDYSEMRDDRINWFADNLQAGHYTVRYQARATIGGSFTVMPATIEAMYQPEIHGRSSKSIVTVDK